ncbi:hypothetical protein AURDEDRAFT_155432 [Auricularia subglabra TFB-10046 SS5]|nr:hypothetical protein AURDEDRAFT_155432 [Auricularia subglabra TFB-10046 SS5]
MYRTFKGDSRLELITEIARSTKSEQIVYAVTTYIQNKQEKGRKTSQIIPKLEELEQRFSGDEMVCEAFHKARADMGMPRSRVLPPSKNYQVPDMAGSPMTPTRRVTVQSEISLGSSSSSAENRDYSEVSTSSSLRSIRPRGASNPLPVPPQYVSPVIPDKFLI